MPKRSTSSPPSQPVISARKNPANERTYAVFAGTAGLFKRSSQLPANNSTTTTFPQPCHKPIAFARVPADHVKRDLGPAPASTRDLNDVKDRRHSKQSERKHDQHRVYCMACELEPAFHCHT
jgi:hypothetical protein